MKCVKDSDLVIAIGTRLNPFGTTHNTICPIGIPINLVQIEIDQHMIGNSYNPTLGVHGDGSETTKKVYEYIKSKGGVVEGTGNLNTLCRIPYEWEEERYDRTLEVDGKTGRLPPKMVLEHSVKC